MKKRWPGGISVSYTHLDVYKRQSLLYGLTEKEEIDLADGSPVHLRKIRLTADGDGWRKGQLKIIGTYGLARKPEKGHSLTGVKMTEK